MTKIKWPEDWAEHEGWPSLRTGGVPLTNETRGWATLHNYLYLKHGADGRLSVLIEQLGGPKAPPAQKRNRSPEEIKPLVLAYYEKHKARPNARSGTEWNSLDHVLRYRGSSLAMLCDEMGLPGRTIERKKRTVPGIQAEAREHYDQTGEWPTPKTSDEWRRIDKYLRDQGLTLARVCGFGTSRPSEVKRQKALFLERVQRWAKAFHTSNGCRPTRETNTRWKHHDDRLRQYRLTLDKVCDSIGLPKIAA